MKNAFKIFQQTPKQATLTGATCSRVKLSIKQGAYQVRHTMGASSGGSRRGSGGSPPPPYGKEIIGLNETKLFHSRGIFKKNEIKSAVYLAGFFISIISGPRFFVWLSASGLILLQNLL